MRPSFADDRGALTHGFELPPSHHAYRQCDAWIFLVGSSGSTTTTLCFLYVLWSFPRFIRHVKSEGADPSVVVRLATFYQLNVSAFKLSLKG